MRTCGDNPNALMELRSFLCSQGVASPPWSSPASAIDALYDRLWLKRDDDRFWSGLHRLIERLETHQLDLSGLNHSAVLSQVTIDRLLADLRSGLKAQGRTRPGWKRFCELVGTSGLLAFLTLGMAAACTDTCEEEAREEGIEDVETYCDLVFIINEAEVPWTVRVNLLDCLPELSEWDREHLLERFEDASDEELAEMLEEMSEDSECNGWNDDDSGH